jgi:hypothetical protein
MEGDGRTAFASPAFRMWIVKAGARAHPRTIRFS